jgi:hypothetical protein
MDDHFFERLAAPFPVELVSWRVGQTNERKKKPEDPLRGKALAYLDARDVMMRLDEVCGPAGWQRAYPHANGKTVCSIGIKVGDEWVWKADGAGDTDIEAEKGALSDAFKRAAVSWGIGRYLYGIPSPWVALDNFKQIEDSERKKLEDLLQKYTTEFEWGSPEDRATLKALANTIRTCLQTVDDVRRYREQNGGVIAQLRVRAREHIEQILQRVEESAQAVAA